MAGRLAGGGDNVLDVRDNGKEKKKKANSWRTSGGGERGGTTVPAQAVFHVRRGAGGAARKGEDPFAKPKMRLSMAKSQLRKRGRGGLSIGCDDTLTAREKDRSYDGDWRKQGVQDEGGEGKKKGDSRLTRGVLKNPQHDNGEKNNHKDLLDHRGKVEEEKKEGHDREGDNIGRGEKGKYPWTMVS